MLLAGENMDLKDYLYLKRMTITAFSEFMGYSRNHLDAVINGRVKPSRGLAKSIERATEGQVKAEDLLKGKGKNET